MESDLLALHWVEHSRVFSQAVGNLRTKTSYTDATLACEGHFFPVHKFVLSTCSQYFNAIFEWTPCINPVVVINNVTCKVLEALLDFMYIGEVSVNESLIHDVIRAAECLRIQGLSIVDDDGVKSNLKNKSKTDSSGPARKRRRTSSSKKKIPASASNSIPSSSQPLESSSHMAVSPPTSTSSHHFNNEGNLNHAENHAENHAADLTPTQQSQRHLSESQNYDTDLSNAPLQNNVPSTYLETQLSPSPQSHLNIQPLQSLHPPSDTIINQHSQISPSPLPTPPHPSALDLSSHEQISEAPVHSAVDIMKSVKVELGEAKQHIPQAHAIVSSEEIPDLLDSLVDMRPQYDSKPEPGDEVATFHSVEPNENLYDFSEELPSASATPSHQEARYQMGPATSCSSKKVDQNSTEDNPALKCSICDKQFQKKESLTRHTRIHNKDHTCKQCPFTTKIYKVFLEHRKKEHASIYKCSICDFTTTRYDNHRRHMVSHEPQKAHKCPECKFSTSRLQNLQKHIRNRHEKK